MIRVGYLEGTYPLFLNELVARGIDTVPLSNGVDNHGKFMGHITKADEINCVVGFLHKVIPLADSGLTALDILHSCQMHKTPVLIIVQTALHGKANDALANAKGVVTLVDPGELNAVFEKTVG